jgi:hypothetical protein
LAGLVIIPKHETMWAKAEEAAECVQTGVGATSIVLGTLIHILTSVVVCCQMGARNTITAALISSWQVVAQVLAGPMPIPQQAFIYICNQNVQLMTFKSCLLPTRLQ